MSRYPFKTVVNQVLATKSVSWSSIYIEKMTARYDLMQREFDFLREKGLISTMDPKRMTVKDIRSYLEYYNKKVNPVTGELISPGEVKRTVGALKHLVEFPYLINKNYKHNRSLEYCLKLFPHLVPKVHHKRLPSWTDEQFDAVIFSSHNVLVTDFERMRAYALACLSACAGDRNKEIRFANKEDIDMDSWEFVIKHPKGERTYGVERCVPIEPECHYIVRMYIEKGLPIWYAKHPDKVDNPALFPSSHSGSYYLTDKSLLKFLKIVEKDVGFNVTYQITRRTYLQRLKNRGVRSDAISLIAGHTNDSTLRKYYAEITPDDAVKAVIAARDLVQKSIFLKKIDLTASSENGAEDGVRTHDLRISLEEV